LLTAFGVGFTPPLQGQACTDLSLRASPIDLCVPLAIAPGAPLHRMRCRWQQLVITHRQGCGQRGGKEFLPRVTEGGDPLDPLASLRQLGEGGLAPTAPIAYRVPLLHERTQRLELGSPTADAPQGLPCRLVEVTLDAQRA
jgi:hypothetical protein